MLAVPKPIDNYLTKRLSGSVFTWREIWDLMIPGILDSLSIMFINTLITALISSNGETSVAAVSLMGPVAALIVNVFNGISAGGTVVVAQCCGRRNVAEKKSAIGITMWLTVSIGLLVCIPMMIFPNAIVHFLYPHAEPIVAEKASVYMVGCLWSILIFTVYTAAFAVLRGLGESKRCLILSIIINVAYFIFSVIFLNFLKMDIVGSVTALILARLLGAICAVLYLFFWRPPEKLSVREFLSYDRSLVRSILKIGVPLSIEQMFFALGSIVSGMYMTILGTTAVATNAIVNSLIGLLYAPAMSIGSLAVTVVGRCIGADKKDEARHYGKSCNQIARILIIVFSLIFYPLLPILLKQYNPSAEAMVMVPRILYASIPALILFWPSSVITPSTLRASNDSVYPSVVSMSVLWLVVIGLGYTLAIPARLGLWGVWIAMWVSWVVRALCFMLRFNRLKWN